MPPVLRLASDSSFATHIPELIRTARSVRVRAYAPYSNIQVGSAILLADGSISSGVNVEAADLDGIHAEEAAIATYFAGDRSRLQEAVMIVAVGAMVGTRKNEAPVVPPCDKCRKMIYELVKKKKGDIDVLLTHPDSEQPMLCSIRELLPSSFPL